jgi:hypothetical protein
VDIAATALTRVGWMSIHLLPQNPIPFLILLCLILLTVWLWRRFKGAVMDRPICNSKRITRPSIRFAYELGSDQGGEYPMASMAAAPRTAVENLPLEERIQRRAYELYVQRGNQSGAELDDWLQAEEEILMAREQARNERGA